MAISTTSYDAIKVGATTTAACKGITDATVNDSRAETDSTYIGSSYVSTTPGARTVSIDLTLDYDPADTQHLALKAAYDGGTTVKVDVVTDADGDTGEKGLTYTCVVTSWTVALSPSGVMSASVTLRPTAAPVAL